MPVITVAASAPSGSASAASQSARKIERTVWIMLSPSLWRDADRTAGKPRHEERDDVSGGLSVRPEARKLRPVSPEEALERLDLTVPSGSKKQRGGSDGAGVVAAPAPAGVKPFATRDALGERAKPALEDGLAGDNSGRDRCAGSVRGQIRGDREGRPLGVGEPVMTLHRLGVRLEERHHAALGRRQRPVLWKARRPSTRLTGIIVTGGARDRIPRVG